jgi:hypothetical protein
MEFVRTDAEIDRLRNTMARNRFEGWRGVSVRYRTRSAIVEAVLTPGLDPAAELIVQVSVFDVETSNCVGASPAVRWRSRPATASGEGCTVCRGR